MAVYKLKRIYEQVSKDDGLRVLVDRLWPRGILKDKVDFWLKEIAPSAELRKWFHHEGGKFAGFAKAYQAELAQNSTVIELRKLAREHKTVTLLYAARDMNSNHAVILKKYMEGKRIKRLTD